MRSLIAIPSVFLLVACRNGPADSGVLVRDSAGITIIENTAPLWGEGQGWRLSPEPLVSIGVLEGAEEYQLYAVRSAVRLGDGRIVVVNMGSHELRFYDAQGEFLTSVGGEGEGPGEFRLMSEVWRALGDSLVIYDYTAGMRLSVFDANGTFARAFHLEKASSSVPLVDALIWGNRVVSRSGIYGPENLTDGLRRDSALYCIHSMDGEVLDTLGRFPGSEMYARSLGEGRSLGMSRPYGRHAVSTATADYWFFGSSDVYEIEAYGRSGTLERLIRRDVTNRPVTENVLEERERRLRESGRPVTAGPGRDIPIPETMPAYGRLIGDMDGNLWVQEYSIYDEPERWAVFDPTGRFLGFVDMPQPGRVMEIGSDYVLGVWRDEMDVERVRMYELVKSR